MDEEKQEPTAEDLKKLLEEMRSLKEADEAAENEASFLDSVELHLRIRQTDGTELLDASRCCAFRTPEDSNVFLNQEIVGCETSSGNGSYELILTIRPRESLSGFLKGWGIK